MNYYIEELRTIKEKKIVERHAGGKARKDIHTILNDNKFESLVIEVEDNREEGRAFDKIKKHKMIYKKWLGALKGLKKGDNVVIQYPVIDHSLFMGKLGRKMKKRGIKVILLIHDLTLFRTYDDLNIKIKIRQYFEEKAMLKQAYKIIVHNDKMKEALINKGFDAEKMVSLEIFDYVIPGEDADSSKHKLEDRTVIIAGNLMKDKAGYIYKLPDCVKYNLYGVGFSEYGKEYISYKGSFLPEELPYEMQGSFGLVWDGPDITACTGVYGEYLRINNPHKTSLYLASGIPVIIWEEAALADFVKKNNIGITVKSINDIGIAIDAISAEEYEKMQKNVKAISEKLRKGYYIINSIKSIR